ncbi:MAG: HAMP domain-containing sensor histidine kinase [Vicinamibacterales bacterium]
MTAILVFTYALLGRALASQDHAVLESMLTRYTVEIRTLGPHRAPAPHRRRPDRGGGTSGCSSACWTAPPRSSTSPNHPAGAVSISRCSTTPALRAEWVTIPHPPDGSVLEVGTRRIGGGVTVQVGRSSHERDDLLGHFRSRAFEVMLLTALIAAFGGLVLTYVGLAPLRALEGTVRSILATGRFDARVDTVGTGDPLDEIGALVNDMLARIQALLGGMRGALDNVAHDLRTPLTRFRNVAESALLADDPARTREGLARALEEADRVNATLTALMDISEAETGTMRLAREPMALAPVVEEAVALYADEAEDKGVALAASVAPTLRVLGDRTRIRQALANLVENAVKYTPPGGAVQVEASAADGMVGTTVRDTGPGIPPADLPLVWDRLYRGDASRTARGLGLGLSLVKAIVEAHGGTVEVRSTPGQGSAFTMRLPAPREPYTGVMEAQG